MSMRIHSGELLSNEICRIVTEQIERAIADLTPPMRDQVEGVHSARRHMKKVRAVLRLVRDEIDDDIYHRENECFRDAARELSAVRDSSAMVEALGRLIEWIGERPERAALEGARERMIAVQRESAANAREHERLFAGVREMLQSASRRVKRWPIERDDFRALRGGLLRTYANGRDGFADALDEPTPEALHEWRKSVKYLWYQIRLLRPLWPQVMGSLARELRDLSASLGDDHDLVTLRSLLHLRPELGGDVGDLAIVTALIDERRVELREQAFSLGARIFSEKPKAFTRRIGGYWKTWSSRAAPKEIATPGEPADRMER